MELEITWGRAVRVWWAYFWRNIVAAVFGLIISAIVGFILGFILGVIGAPENTIRMIVFPVGVMIGIAVSVVPIKAILGKDFGEFRLVLVKNESSAM